jgi:hypothetical protein
MYFSRGFVAARKQGQNAPWEDYFLFVMSKVGLLTRAPLELHFCLSYTLREDDSLARQLNAPSLATIMNLVCLFFFSTSEAKTAY